jgi:hypothetical protein
MNKWSIKRDKCVVHPVCQITTLGCGSISPVLDPFRFFVVDNGSGDGVAWREAARLIISVNPERCAQSGA